MPDATPVAPAAPVAAEPAAAAVVAEAPKPPEKPLSPIERAAKAWDNIRMAAEARAKAATVPEPVEAKPAEEKKPEPEKPVEAKPPEEKPKEEESVSAKFALVARLEKQAREALKSTKAKEEALAKREAEVQAKADAYEEKRRAARLNPIAWLQEGGVSLEDAARFQANGGKPTPELQAAAALAEVESMKKQQAEARAKAAEDEKQRAKAEADAKYHSWRQSVVDFVKANASTYELVNQQEAHELVPAVIQKHFDDTGKVLSEAEAASQVEKHLEQQAEKLLQSKKLAAKFAPPKPAEPAQPRSVPSPTLNNGLTASASSGGRPKTWAEKKEAARLAMEKAAQK